MPAATPHGDGGARVQLAAGGAHWTRRLALVGIVAMLGACSTAPRRVADVGDLDALARQAAREAGLAADATWSFSGRIAISNAQDSGSGRIEWQQDGGRYTIELRAPVTRRSWRLSGEPGWAQLEGVDGGPFEGDSAEALLLRHVGWNVPLADLASWARGARAKRAAETEFGPDGRLSRLSESGWVIEYRAWGDGEPLLPSKVFAQRGDERVRLLVDRWN